MTDIVRLQRLPADVNGAHWPGEVPTWQRSANCLGVDPDLFFPVGSTGPAVEQIASAKAVCGTCEARSSCLEFALATNQESGIWGGTTEEERRKLRKLWLARQRRGG